ncbi:MAG: sodium:solute symporter [Woeseiaceae bacterium]|nr:sodium:solute symporter [Woeseiaceae bacterium]MDX2608337.1 sodium:solute symporter [Woeseiaceae bacterium]
MNINIGAVDATIVIFYMLAVLTFGIWIGRNKRSSSDYFLGDRSLPWGAVLLSIVATETSTVTFLSIPGLAAAAGGNLTFLQITIGYIVGRIAVIFVLLPLYFKGQPFTAYEVLESRFGKASRRTASSLFLVTRNVSDSLRLFLTALVLQIVLGLDLTGSVIFIGAVTILYTFIGGAKSVIWNDCIQFVIYMLGAAAAAAIILDITPGGLQEVLRFAAEEQKLQVFDFDTSLFKPTMTFWAGLAGGAFLTAATHGTDQLMVQRYLSAKGKSEASLALGISGFIVLFQFAVFLLIGIGLASLFGSSGDAELSSLKNDQLFAYFVVNYMPVGLLGLTLAAVFAAAMSTLSSSLNSSAAAFINDLYLPLRQNEPDERSRMRAGQIATVVFGVLQTGLAILFGLVGTDESTVSNVLKISGFAIGPVLGLYFLAVFAPRVAQRAALSGFVAGVAVLSFVAMATPVYWAWYAAVGSLTTLGAGVLAQLLYGSKSGAPQE